MNTFSMQGGIGLEAWLTRATCGLAAASAAQVRKEIQEHYESACEEALVGGAAPEDAERAAVASLGDAKTANRQYRKVLLTGSEARLLRQTRWEQGVVCARPRWLLAIVAVGLCASVGFLLRGGAQLGVTLLIGLLGIAFVFAAPFLPIYTRSRGRVVRVFRWAWLATVLFLVTWPNPMRQSWLFPGFAWLLIWLEYRRFSLRRKLPVAEWPKQLYL